MRWVYRGSGLDFNASGFAKECEGILNSNIQYEIAGKTKKATSTPQ
jgi:hypothetical protein